MRSRIGWTSLSTVTGATARRDRSAGRSRIGRIAAAAVTALLVGALVPGAMTSASAAVAPSGLLAANGFPASYGDGNVNLGLGPVVGGEGFYFNATATGGTLEVYEAALEGTYVTAPTETTGQEITFSRVRIRVKGLDAGQTYTITHPYGVDTFVAKTDPTGNGRSIDSTIDVGCVAATCDFGLAGAGFLGDNTANAKFLKQVNAPVGTLGDPLVAQAVTGAPSGTDAVIISGPNAGGPNVNTLTVSDFAVQGEIVVPPAPTASFTTSVASGAAPLLVAMTDTSTDIPTSWAWNFGDGTTSTEQNPSVTYAAEGTYTVTLTATNATGASAPVTQTIVVTPPTTPPTTIPPTIPPTTPPTTIPPTTPPTTIPPTTPPTTIPPTTPPTEIPPTTPPTEIPPTTPPTTIPPTTPPTTPSAALIKRVSSSHGEVGDKVTITGKGFGKAGIVKFGNVSSTALYWSDTKIVVRVRGRDYDHPVLVTVTPANGTASNGIRFRIESGHHNGHDGNRGNDGNDGNHGNHGHDGNDGRRNDFNCD